MLSLILQRVFAAGFMGLMMLSPAMASDLMFGTLQFRATIGSMPSSAGYLSITKHGAMAATGCWPLKAAFHAKLNFTQWRSQMAL
jgi:hypothetical protein